MNIENVRYVVVSKGEEEPEQFPQKGDIFSLHVKEKNDSTTDSPHVSAQIMAEYIGKVGKSARVTGPVSIQNEEHRGTARYELASYPKDTVIGQLIVKKLIEDV